MRWFFVVCITLLSIVHAQSLKSASRWDISISPYRYGLQGDLRRTLSEYRKAVNQASIDVGQDRQIRAETERMMQLLKSRGYYQASILSNYDDEKLKPAYFITLGTRFEIASIEQTGNYEPVDDEWQTLKIGQPLTSTLVLAQQAALKSHVEKHACYFVQKVSHEIRLNETNGTADVTMVANVSQPAIFGDVIFTGIGQINENFLLRTSGISKGRCYQRAAIDNAVFSLFDTGLFRQVRPSFELNENHEVVVTFETQKRKKRTISAGIGVKSEQGPAVTAGWQHRDLLGMAQTLTVDTEVQREEQTFGVDLEIPSFFDRRNRLNLENEILHETVDVESYQYSTSAVLERKASSDDYFEYGIGYKRTDEKVDDQWKVYHQLRFPFLYQFDSVTNPFNPSQGVRYSFGLEPIFDIEDDLTPYIKTSLGTHLFLADNDEATLASRVQWDALWYGSVLDSSKDNVPLNELYTAGGSTSVRGYSYQSIKSSDQSEDIGGIHRWLLINELRVHLNENWGVVGFVDVGSVSDKASPLLQSNWYTGIGFGVRYYTRFAPIRVDFAFPLDRDFEDRLFHVYFSLGQAF